MPVARWRWALFVLIGVAGVGVTWRATQRFAARSPHAVADFHPADLPEWNALRFGRRLNDERRVETIDAAKSRVIEEIRRIGAGVVRDDAMAPFADRIAARLAYVLSGDEEAARAEAKADGATRIGPAPGLHPKDEERARRWVVGWKDAAVSVDQIVVRRLDLKSLEGNALQATRITGRSPLRSLYPEPPADGVTFEAVIPCLIGPEKGEKTKVFLGIAYDWSPSMNAWRARDLIGYTHEVIVPVPPL